MNNARHVPGSLHDDATATRLGFRGGTVAGSIHLELFPPLLLKAFKRIAEMRMLLRFMKASSPLYKDAISS